MKKLLAILFSLNLITHLEAINQNFYKKRISNSTQPVSDTNGPTSVSNIDLNNYQISKGYYSNKIDPVAFNLGCYAFNYAPELTPIFAAIAQKYNIDTLVETGTFKGGTTVVFSMLFDEVYTIEIVNETYVSSKERLSAYSNVHCLLGSSEKVLEELLPSLQDKRVMFYLDAHWESHWPLLEELQAISQTHKDNCVIVIDDFKVPGRPDIPYDYYGNKECSLDYIKDQLVNIFTSYSISYVIPKSTLSRAKIVIIPNQWK